jgi:hypothetical protein
MSKAIFMETTEVPAVSSAAEITSLLVKVGAKRITTEYHEGRLVGIGFVLIVAQSEYSFTLPARTDSVFKLLLRNKPFSSSYSRCSRQVYEERMRQMGEQVGWRQLFRWVQAQLAVIEVGMVSAHEVFLPYMLVKGRTVLQMFEEQRFKMLTEGEKECSR